MFRTTKISIAPLILYRILFGAMLFFGGLWSISKDDIAVRYLEPQFFFKYYGLEWIGYVGDTGIYLVYALWLIASLGIMLGAFYRLSLFIFLMAFSYLHFLDATNYINHYYAISLLSLLLLFVPANASHALDVWRNPSLRKTKVAQWQVDILHLQIAIIYIGAAIAKVNTDWLLQAMPLKIWLIQQKSFPVLGIFFDQHWFHVLASWGAMLFDLTIVFWLSWRRTTWLAYLGVLGFHILTGLLLNIGLFPILMIVNATLFLPDTWHQKILRLQGVSQKVGPIKSPKRMVSLLLSIYFIIQLAMPLRHHLYPGDAMWTEEGYRFSWWVMLVEKDGFATFYVEDRNSSRRWEVTNTDFLSLFQEKRMSIRPDHILQFAHHLSAVYARRFDLDAPRVRADVFVTLNGRTSQRLIDAEVDLAQEVRKLSHYDWILPFQK